MNSVGGNILTAGKCLRQTQCSDFAHLLASDWFKIYDAVILLQLLMHVCSYSRENWKILIRMIILFLLLFRFVFIFRCG